MTMTAKVKAYFASFTIEPSIFIWIIGISVAGSTQIMTDLLIWKVCKSEVGYNDTICEDLDDYPEEQDEVSERDKVTRRTTLA